MRSRVGLGVCLLWVLSVAACGASNPYGHGREYAPSDEEEPYFARAIDVSYEEVRRDPQSFAKRTIGWFGVVRAVKRLPDGQVQVALELRFHQPRHLCSDQFESSCLVTISERQGGPFSTTLRLRPEDAQGSERLNVGSLVKLYGTPNGDFDERGGPVLKTDWYRHWPIGAFVSSSSNSAMRR
jgi:hypothetical protein